MFCGHCGKTIKQEDESCRSCGKLIGETRFPGNSFTAAQPRSEPETAQSDPVQRTAHYTRTTYMGQAASANDDIYSRTIYRPALSDNEILKSDGLSADIPDKSASKADDGTQAVSEPAADIKRPALKIDLPARIVEYKAPSAHSETETIIKPDSQEDPESQRPKHTIEIASIQKRGISPEMRRHLDKMEDRSKRIQTRNIQVAVGAGKAPREEVIVDDVEESDDIAFQSPWRKPLIFAFTSLLVVALVILGVFWINHIAERTKIAGVTRAAYTNGLDLIKTIASDDYRLESAQMFDITNDALISARWQQEQNKINELLPQAPLENDKLFIDALTAIHNAIRSGNVYDGLDIAVSGAKTLEEIKSSNSAQSWGIIKNAIKNLEGADNAAVLSNIKNGVKINLVMEQPSPSINPEDTIQMDYSTVYFTLRRGTNDSDAVKNLQGRLKELGYFTDTVDGNFGPKTETAVKRFEVALNLKATGVATPELQKSLFDPDAPRRTAAPAASGAPASAKPTPSSQSRGNAPKDNRQIGEGAV